MHWSTVVEHNHIFLPLIKKLRNYEKLDRGTALRAKYAGI